MRQSDVVLFVGIPIAFVVVIAVVLGAIYGVAVLNFEILKWIFG